MNKLRTNCFSNVFCLKKENEIFETCLENSIFSKKFLFNKFKRKQHKRLILKRENQRHRFLFDGYESFPNKLNQSMNFSYIINFIYLKTFIYF